MARSYQDLPVPVKRTHAGNHPAPDTEDVFIPQTRRDYRVFIVVGMLLFATLLLLLQLVVTPWWQSVTDQWQYGSSKIFTLEVVVGHQDSAAQPTHFLAFDLHGKITIIEFPGSSNANTHIYTSATLIGTGSNNRVVTLQVTDINGDHKPDLVIHIEGIAATAILYNTGSSFTWTETHQ